MNNMPRAALLCCTCYIVLFALSFIPPQSVCGVELRRANVLSSLIHFSLDDIAPDIELEIDDTEYEVDLEQVALEVEDVAQQSASPLSQVSYAWSDDESAEGQGSSGNAAKRELAAPRRLIEVGEITPIHDYSHEEVSALRRFYQKLLSPDSLVRIAVMGDSFIEADILTADLREALQSRYGGVGCGFAPMESPLTQYRTTIKTSSKGWNSYNVMQRNKTAEPYASLFSIGGWVSAPAAGATTTWSCSTNRKYIESCDRALIHFVAHDDCSVAVSVNSAEPRTFNIEGGNSLRQIEVNEPDITSLKITILSGHQGFVGYGALFEGRSGVTLDNYSVRSNNGQAMFWTSPTINAQIDKAIGGYDLVILQYGLNIMQSGVNNYTRYGEQVEKMINYVERCFPKAAVVVMGVSDRSFKKEGSYLPMSEAERLTEFQRSAAESQGVGFWSTYTAMQAQGGMSTFVANGWAAKDYTHINFAGGRQVAWAMVDAIVEQVEHERSLRVVKVEREPIIAPSVTEQLHKELLECDPNIKPLTR